MDRRDFIRQALIAALAAGPVRSLPIAADTDYKYPFDLPDELWYGMYDNFDGIGCYQPDTEEYLARAGEFSPDIWTFYGPESEISHMDDLNGTKLSSEVAVDEFGLPVSIYRDPAVATIAHYLIGGNGYENRDFFVRRLLNDQAVRALYSERDPEKRVCHLLAIGNIFSQEGESAANYLRNGDLRLLEGMSPSVFEAVQVIRDQSDYVRGQGPRRVRFLNYGLPTQNIEMGSFEIVPSVEVEVWRDVHRAVNTDEPVNMPPPRRAGRRVAWIPFRPNPGEHVAKVWNRGANYDVRIQMPSPRRIRFADFSSWSADVMMPDLPETADNTGFGMDFHTSIPEQPPAISWLCGIGFGDRKSANHFCALRYLRNKNTDVGFWEWIEPWEAGESAWLKGHWYNIRMDMKRLSETSLRISWFVNGVRVFDYVPEDGEILLDPTRLAFGPIRSFVAERAHGETGEAIGYVDNIRAVYGRPWQTYPR